MLRLTLVGLLMVFVGLSAPAQSATYRYSFDVVQSDMDFYDLFKLEASTYSYLPWKPAEEAYYIITYHPLGKLYGQGGRVVMDVQVEGPGLHIDAPGQPTDRWSDGSISCVSGFLCSVGLFNFQTLVLDLNRGLQFSVLEFTINGPFFSVSLADYSQPLSYLSGFSDFLRGTYSCQFEPDCIVDFWYPRATFDLANFSVTDITAAPTPVPLPAGAPLLAAGLLALGLGARRRKRAV